MKIFNEENGVKKVYVQLNDLLYIIHYDEVIPRKLFTQVTDNAFVVTDANRYKFKEFSDPDLVEYFTHLDWVLDYKQVRKMTESEIIDWYHAIIDEMNDVAKRFNNISDNSVEEKERLWDKHELLDFKRMSLIDILLVKQGKKQMPFPIVPDCDGFTLQRDSNTCDYAIKQGLNPLQHLLYRLDGQPFDSERDKNIPQGLINTGDGLCISSNMETNEFFGNFKLSRELSTDKQYLVTTFRILVPEEEKTLDKREKSLGKRIKERLQSLRSKRN